MGMDTSQEVSIVNKRIVLFFTLMVVLTLMVAIAADAWSRSTQSHNATLVRDDIGYALTCWNWEGEIFCQEIVTP